MDFFLFISFSMNDNIEYLIQIPICIVLIYNGSLPM